MSKKEKHITVNLTSDEYDLLVKQAETEKRNPTNYAYLLIERGMKNEKD